MYFQRPNILSHLAKVPVLFLYVSFFIVQLFFNFDIVNHSNNTTLLSSYTSVAEVHHYPATKKTIEGKEKKQPNSLNKRFKPQVILTYNFIAIKSLIYYLETKAFVSHSEVFIPALFLLSQTFRGPPVVA